MEVETTWLLELVKVLRNRLTLAGAEFISVGQAQGKVRIYLRGRNQDNYIEGLIEPEERPYVSFERL